MGIYQGVLVAFVVHLCIVDDAYGIINIDIIPVNLKNEFTVVLQQINILPDGADKTALLQGLEGVANDTNSNVLGMVQEGQIKGMLQAIVTCIPKFKSKEPKQIVSGVADLLYGLGFCFGGPVGFTVGSLAFLVNAALGMNNANALYKSEESVISSALADQEFRDIRDKAEGALQEMKLYQAAHDGFRKHWRKAGNVSESDARSIADFKKITGHMKLAIQVLNKALNRNETNEESGKSYKLIILFSKLCNFHMLILFDTIRLLEDTKTLPGTASSAESVYESVNSTYGDKLEFLRLEGTVPPKYYGILGYFYPPKQDAEASELDKSLDALGIIPVSQPKISGRSRLSPVAFDNFLLCTRFTPAKLQKSTVTGCTNAGSTSWTMLTEMAGGFFTISMVQEKKHDKRSNLCVIFSKTAEKVTDDSQDAKQCVNDAILFRFVPIKKDFSTFLISPKALPAKFLYMSDSKPKIVKLAPKDPGNKGYWKIFASTL